MAEKAVTTYSSWRTFRNCRKKHWWRYVRELELRERDSVLWLGSVAHKGLELRYTDKGDLIPSMIDASYPNRTDPKDRQNWHLAHAMMAGYAKRYLIEDFEVVAVEKIFQGEIINPETGAMSRSFVLAGKTDMIVKIGAEYWLNENKTASVIDGTYLESLWTDFQITLYSHYIGLELGVPIAGVIYNILGKPKLQQAKGETEDEFAARQKALILKSKSGKTSAKRRMPESDEAFRARLTERYSDPTMFHRETIYVSKDRIEVLQAELWELTQALLDARRRDVWYQNTDQCYWYRRPCAYLPLCRAQDPETVIPNLYEHREAHEELGNGLP